tara:strand:+ start:67988 stop:68884 length:897 start_codon:yes stop_codon:yes gene_type:complete
MIKYIHRNELDDVKYNECIEKSSQSLVYGYSWYLDSVVEHWSAIVLNDYEAVMPIPNTKKYFIKYVYPPFWILQLGIFSQVDNYDKKSFINCLKVKFRFVELRLNSDNEIDPPSQINRFQELQLISDYKSIKESYKSDRKKDLKRAAKHHLAEKWSDSPENLISLFKNNVGKRTPNIKQQDYEKLNRLINTCIERGVGEILSIYETDILVASAFFLKNKKTITILCSSTDFTNRKNGANTFLIDRAIYKYQQDYEIFNFGGSSIESIANYFLSFGAESVNYEFLKFNNLPLILKFLKK